MFNIMQRTAVTLNLIANFYYFGLTRNRTRAFRLRSELSIHLIQTNGRFVFFFYVNAI